MPKKPIQKSIFELERRVDISEKISDIEFQLRDNKITCKDHHSRTIMSLINQAMQTWPYREGNSGISSYLDKKGIQFDSDEHRTIDDIYYTLELYLNLLYWAPEHERRRSVTIEFEFSGQTLEENLKQYIENIEFVLEQCNLAVRKRTADKRFPQYVITKRDADVDATIEVAPEISEILLSYLDIRNSKDIAFKKKAIRDIADYLEPKRKEYSSTSYSSLCDSLFYGFNSFGIRHNNKNQQKLPKAKFIDLCDKLFYMSLHLIQSDRVKLLKAEIDSYKSVSKCPNGQC